MTSRPKIDPAIVLDDHWAGRIVDQMIAHMTKDAHTAINSYIQTNQADSEKVRLGSPKGQRRFLDRQVRAAGRAHLMAAHSPGKRVSFIIEHDLWVPTKYGNGLVAARIVIAGQGPRQPIRQRVIDHTTIPRHALVRLIQRAGCQTIEDVVQTLRDLWPMLYVAQRHSYGFDDDNRSKPYDGCFSRLPPAGEGGWVLPFTCSRANAPTVAAVFSRDTDRKGVYAIVPTFLEFPNHIPHPQREAARLLLAKLGARDAKGEYPGLGWLCSEANDAKAKALFDAATLLTAKARQPLVKLTQQGGSNAETNPRQAFDTFDNHV